MQYAYIWSGRDAYNAKQLYGCAAPVQTVACRLHAPCARRRKARKKAAAPALRRPRRLCGGRLVLCRYHARAIIILAAL